MMGRMWKRMRGFVKWPKESEVWRMTRKRVPPLYKKGRAFSDPAHDPLPFLRVQLVQARTVSLDGEL